MCRVISFVSASGGVGKSSLIYHVANEISIKYKVCVLDSYFSINDLSIKFLNDDGVDFKEYLIGKLGSKNVLNKMKNNLYVVKSNDRFDYLKHSELIKFFISEISMDFDYVLIDVNSFDLRILTLMIEASNEIIFICTDDEMCIRNTSKMLSYIKNFDSIKSIKYILNKARIIHSIKNKCFNLNDISEVLKIEAISLIPKFYYNNHKFINKRMRKSSIYIKKLSYAIITNKLTFVDEYKKYKGVLGLIKRIRCFKYE